MDTTPSLVFLDTHIVVWLAEKNTSKLSPLACELLENTPILAICPMVMLELHYLYCIKRINQTAQNIQTSLNKTFDLQVQKEDFANIVHHAMTTDWTRDVFDRLITASAIAHNAPLITADKTILQHYKNAVF